MQRLYDTCNRFDESSKQWMERKEYSLDSDELSPNNWIRLDLLIEKIQNLQEKYGKRAFITFDAGYNNVGAIISPSKAVKDA